MNTLIQAKKVSNNQRLSFLPKYFKTVYLQAETSIYSIAGNLCENYNGGYWEFFELDNGSFFVALDSNDPVRVFVDTNGYEGEMSAEAFGIVVSLYVLNLLCWKKVDRDYFSEQYYLLRDYISQHPEAKAIYAAID